MLEALEKLHMVPLLTTVAVPLIGAERHRIGKTNNMIEMARAAIANIRGDTKERKICSKRLRRVLNDYKTRKHKTPENS